MDRPRLPRLSELPVSLKLVISLTLVVLGAGYLIALVSLYFTYSLTDGEPELTVTDFKRAFYGSRENTTLAAKIQGGSMEQFLTKRGDKEKILSWIQDGAPRDKYESQVRLILQRSCVRCHNPSGLQRFAPLTTYEEVMAVTQIDRGEPAALWARVAHTHIQSLGLVFLVLGGVFSLTSLPEGRKAVIVVLPFAALLIDFGSRFLARFNPNLVYLMFAAGACVGLSFAVLILFPLYDMWLRRGPSQRAAESGAAHVGSQASVDLRDVSASSRVQ